MLISGKQIDKAMNEMNNGSSLMKRKAAFKNGINYQTLHY
jgi:hypothetical protein